MITRGALIVLEGCDKAGKSTQCHKLVEGLCKKGISAKLLAFPDRSTSTGKLIDAYLRKQEELPDKTVHLLFSANRWELEPQMKALLNDGVTLIVDRYSYSGVAFSAAKKDMDVTWCYNPEIGLPKPDLVLFLTLGEDALMKRGGFGSERYETSEFQKKVNFNFQQLKDDSWKVVDADKDVDSLYEELMKYIEDAIEQAKSSSLNCLYPKTSIPS